MWTQLTNSQTSIARHRDTLGVMSKDDCSAFEHTAKFHPGMAVKVSATIQSGEPFSDASRNGKRDCGIHLFSSSYPLGNAGFLGTPFADAQTVGFHEYFHTVQHAYIFTLDRGTREDMLGRCGSLRVGQNLWLKPQPRDSAMTERRLPPSGLVCQNVCNGRHAEVAGGQSGFEVV